MMHVRAVNILPTDWSLVQLDKDKINGEDFKGNRLFVGGNKTHEDWFKYMFPDIPNPDDSKLPTRDQMLLPLHGYIPEDKLCIPRDRDIRDAQALLAVKHGRATGTTFGFVNGLASITRVYLDADSEDGRLNFQARELIICGYDTRRNKVDRFSAGGDSGAFVAGRDGRLIGQITGGAGATNSTDRTYVTPYFVLKEEIEKEYPGFSLLSTTA